MSFAITLWLVLAIAFYMQLGFVYRLPSDIKHASNMLKKFVIESIVCGFWSHCFYAILSTECSKQHLSHLKEIYKFSEPTLLNNELISILDNTF